MSNYCLCFPFYVTCLSHFLYPSKHWKIGEGSGDVQSASGDGKYELLSVANDFIADEIKNLMSRSKSIE